jgi:PBP1b-binding outer membrane lipoprotein LpoB
MKRLLLVLSLTILMTGCVKQDLSNLEQQPQQKIEISNPNLPQTDFENLIKALDSNDKNAVLNETVDAYQALQQIMDLYDIKDEVYGAVELQTKRSD